MSPPQPSSFFVGNHSRTINISAPWTWPIRKNPSNLHMRGWLIWVFFPHLHYMRNYGGQNKKIWVRDSATTGDKSEHGGGEGGRRRRKKRGPGTEEGREHNDDDDSRCRKKEAEERKECVKLFFFLQRSREFFPLIHFSRQVFLSLLRKGLGNLIARTHSL